MTARQEGAAVLVVLATLTWVVHARVTDPDVTFADDVGGEHVPKAAHAYANTSEGLGTAAPLYHAGVADHRLDGTHSLPVLLPVVNAALATVAPREVGALATFEWRLTSGALLAGLLATYVLLRREGARSALALCGSTSYMLSGALVGEWGHHAFARSVMLLPLLALALGAAGQADRVLPWLFVTAGAVLVLGQTFNSAIVVVVLTAVFAVHAALEGRLGRRSALGALAAACVVLAAVGPAYLRAAGALGASAHLASWRSHPDVFVEYARFGTEWFDAAELLLAGGSTPAGGAGALPMAGLLVGLAGALGVGGRPRMAPTAASLMERMGRTLLVVGLLATWATRIPREVLVTLREGVRVGPLRLALPDAAGPLFHTPTRTWLVLATFGLALAGTLQAERWVRGESPRRLLWAALALYALLLVGATLGAPSPPSAARIAGSIALVAGMLGGLAVLGRGAPEWRPAAGFAIATMALGTAAWSAERHLQKSMPGEGARLLRLHEDVRRNVPREVWGRLEHRLVTNVTGLDNVVFYLGSSGLGGYPARLVPPEPIGFYQRLGVLSGMRLPYTLDLDLGRLRATGLADLLGVRYWLVSGPWPVGDPGRVVSTAIDPPLRFVETRTAFRKAWAVHTVHAQDAEPISQLLALGREGRLATEGLVPATVAGAIPGREAGAAAARADVLSVEPGRIRVHTDSPVPFVVATNEFYHPRWAVRSGGAPLARVRVNLAFLGTVVGAGRHQVQFTKTD